jgi:hypothetical protein
MSRNQISGAISLDVSGVADAVHEQVKPALDRLADQLRQITADLAPVVLSFQELADALARAGAHSATDIARKLQQAGYSVIVTDPDSPEPVTAQPSIDHSAFLPPL